MQPYEQHMVIWVKFMRFASHVFVAKSFQNVFIHQLECFGKFLYFSKYYSHFVELNQFLEASRQKYTSLKYFLFRWFSEKYF